MKKFFTKKKIIWFSIALLVILGIGYKVVKSKDPAKNIVTETARKQDLKQTVLATGQVVSQTDLSLGFKASGIVSKVLVKEGDKAKEGDVLATLEQKDQMASLTSARGGLAQAKANYERVLSGASNEEVVVAQKAVDAAQTAYDNAQRSLNNTKQQQDVLVSNAYNSLLNSSFTAVAGAGNTGTVIPTITGTYTGQDQGQYLISTYQTGGGLRFQVKGLEDAEGPVDGSSQLMGKKGLFISFPSTNIPTNNTWTVSVPNTQAANYVINYNSYQAALQAKQVAIDAAQAAVNSAKAALDQAQASLDLKKASARPADIEAAQAQILTATGQVQAAEAAFENTIIRAPAVGVITKVDIKPGEQATSMKEVIVLQDVNNLHVEANISEANISSLKPGQTVDLTFDALGPDRHFKGTVQTINPASTVVSGVVNYKVTANLEKIDEIKPGMTANMVILVDQINNVLAVPLRAVLPKDGQKFIKVIKDSKKKTYEEVAVTTGLEADGGLVQITSGLSEGQEIVTLIKK